ncbi:DMT family transporter [Sulfidibacter corallicola]|uniref:DMT family transporter n=1 Tax=Sulfidibacter corallicola TaxID=2818388 RepID=A0A8A4TGZ7_SULCO|nr:DMT family transporter [Sulfidibacter corallicola]QTD49196.1 DMT family transporter [Sulfidibacter corallicola]
MVSIFQQSIGEVAALAAAFLWAIATLYYAKIGGHFPPIRLNLLKGLIALVLVGVALPFSNESMQGFSGLAVFLLLASGILGIGLGDTAYFEALNRLGPRRALLMETLAPPIAAVLSFLFLKDALSWRAWLGMAITMVGVAWVISERTPEASVEDRSLVFHGAIFGFLAAACQAGGAVLSSAAFAKTDIGALGSAGLRLVAGIAFMPLLIWWRGKPKAQVAAKRTDVRRPWLILVFATFIGTFLCLWLQQISLKTTSAGIAQTLLVTSPLFGIPLAMIQGERVSLRAVLGVLAAIGGIALFF